MKNIREREIDAGLQVAGITPTQVKHEFRALFLDASDILEGRGPTSLKADVMPLYVGFKAGLLVGSDILVKRKSRTTLPIDVVVNEAIEPGEALLIAPDVFDIEGNIVPSKVAKIVNLDDIENPEEVTE